MDDIDEDSSLASGARVQFRYCAAWWRLRVPISFVSFPRLLPLSSSLSASMVPPSPRASRSLLLVFLRPARASDVLILWEMTYALVGHHSW